MENFGGRACLTDCRATLGYSFLAHRALEKQEKWIDKIACDSQKQFSREEQKIRKSLMRLQYEKYKQEQKDIDGGANESKYLGDGYEDNRRSFDGSSHHSSRFRQNENSVHHHHHHHHHYYNDGPNQYNNEVGRKREAADYYDSKYGDRHLRDKLHKNNDHHKDDHPYIRDQAKRHRDGMDNHNSKDSKELKKAAKAGQHNSKDIQHVKFGEGKKKHTLPDISSKIPVPLTKLLDAESVTSLDSTSKRDIRSSSESLYTGSTSTMAVKCNPSSSIRSFYDEAIKNMTTSDRMLHQPSLSCLQSESKRYKTSMEKLTFDGDTFKELEGIIKEAKINNRRESIGGSSFNYGNRHQRRRLMHLQQLLDELRPRIRPEVPFDPMSILECRYLRLSKMNVEHLENIIRATGGDPGLHAHSEAFDYNIWK